MNSQKDMVSIFPEHNIYEAECPLYYAINIFQQKWKLPIIWYLSLSEKARYNELKRRVKGITNIMLTKSLRELEDDNIVIREEYNTVPPKVEYSLSERGRRLLPILEKLNEWGVEQIKSKELE
ncbi:MAG: helix-turn-helix domain-containing protein [bacterium]|nr:helix-turn-helix domain-containing protein [bacterium]